MNPRIEELRQRLEREPGSRLFAQLAEELRKDGDVVGAIKVCREGLARHPAYPSAHMTLGRALMDGGDFAGARGEFESVLKGAPDNILASRFLGESLEALGDLPGAIERFRLTLAQAPGDRSLVGRVEELEKRLREAASGPKPIPLATVEDSFEIDGPELQDRTLAPTSPALEPPETVGRVSLASEESAPEASIPVVEPSSFEPSSFEPVPVPVAAPGEDEGFEVFGRGAEGGTTVPPTVMPRLGEREAVFDFDGMAEVAPEEPPTIGLPMAAPVVPAPAATPPAAPAEAPLPEEAHLSTPTLAELYFNQGFADKAIEVYRELLARDPGNGQAAARLAEIEALSPPASPGVPPVSPDPPSVDARAQRRQALERTIARLEQLRLGLRRA